jgi:hypothetical protein
MEPITTHEYADDTIHTLACDDGTSFEIRLKRSLGGDNGVGFSMACVFIAECVGPENPFGNQPFVIKISDPRYVSAPLASLRRDVRD